MPVLYLCAISKLELKFMTDVPDPSFFQFLQFSIPSHVFRSETAYQLISSSETSLHNFSFFLKFLLLSNSLTTRKLAIKVIPIMVIIETRYTKLMGLGIYGYNYTRYLTCSYLSLKTSSSSLRAVSSLFILSKSLFDW